MSAKKKGWFQAAMDAAVGTEDALSQVKADVEKLPESEAKGLSLSSMVIDSPLSLTYGQWFQAPKPPLQKAVEYALGAMNPASIHGPLERTIDTTTEDGYRVVLQLTVLKEAP